MGVELGVDEVQPELARAVGLVALCNVTLAEAAEQTGVEREEIEEALERAALAEPLGVTFDGDLSAELDSLLDPGPV